MKKIMYVDYNFETQEPQSIVFDKELNCTEFMETHNLSDGQMCMLKNVDGRLVLWITDFVERDSVQQLSFDFEQALDAKMETDTLDTYLYDRSLASILYSNKD